MFWNIIIITLLFAIPILLVVQYIWLSRIYYFDKALDELRGIRHDAIMHITAEIENPAYNVQEISEIRNFLSFLNSSIVEFSKLRPGVFNLVKSKVVIVDIDVSARKAEQGSSNSIDVIKGYKVRYSRVLLLIFTSSILFRSRLVINLLSAVVSVLTFIGFYKITSTVDKLKRIISTYKMVEKNSHDQHASMC